MNGNRKGPVRPARHNIYEQLSQRLEAFVERERRANKARWTELEDEKLTQARLALFGCAPK